MTIVISQMVFVVIACESESKPANIASLQERSFPIELEDGADQLEPEQVITAYIEYFGGSRLAPRESVESGETNAITDYCSDFTGQVVHNPPISGATFFWNVKKPTELPWNSVLVVVDFNDPTVAEKLGETRGSASTIPWSPSTLNSTAVFRSPDCS